MQNYRSFFPLLEHAGELHVISLRRTMVKGKERVTTFPEHTHTDHYPNLGLKQNSRLCFYKIQERKRPAPTIARGELPSTG
jgi:hypothetical protein